MNVFSYLDTDDRRLLGVSAETAVDLDGRHLPYIRYHRKTGVQGLILAMREAGRFLQVLLFRYEKGNPAGFPVKDALGQAVSEQAVLREG